MEIRVRLTRVRVAAIVGAGALVAAGAAVATTALTGNYTDAQGGLHACVNTTNGNARIIEPGAACRQHEVPIVWSQRGATGATGPAGPKGDKGDQGDTGPPGQLAGAPCNTHTGVPGRVELTVQSSNVMTFRCVASPEAEVDYCSVEPLLASVVQAGQSPGVVRGIVYESGITIQPGWHPTIRAEFGYGSRFANVRDWSWTAASFGGDFSGDDVYESTMPGLTPGDYAYTFRFRTTSGATWTYCDLDRAGSLPGLTFDQTLVPTLRVLP